MVNSVSSTTSCRNAAMTGFAPNISSSATMWATAIGWKI